MLIIIRMNEFQIHGTIWKFCAQNMEIGKNPQSGFFEKKFKFLIFRSRRRKKSTSIFFSSWAWFSFVFPILLMMITVFNLCVNGITNFKVESISRLRLLYIAHLYLYISLYSIFLYVYVWPFLMCNNSTSLFRKLTGLHFRRPCTTFLIIYWNFIPQIELFQFWRYVGIR
jgi:hypothetical protein